MAKSYISCIILLFCTILIETAILSNITILPAVPDLLLICVLYISVLNGRTQGEIVGFCSGFFLDLLSGVPLGFNCLIRTIIGYLSGILGYAINCQGFFVPALFGFLATLLKFLLVWLVSFFYPAIVNTSHIISFTFLFELLCNTLLTPILFMFFSLFNSFFSIKYEEHI
jgi:rod shape-determining protein MreD